MTGPAPFAPFLNAPRPLYWVTQLGAWTFFFGLFYTISYLNDELQPGVEKVILLELVTSISVSHLFRHFILRNQWLSRDIGHVLPRMALTALLLALLASLIETSLHDLFLQRLIGDHVHRKGGVFRGSADQRPGDHQFLDLVAACAG